MVEEIFVIYNPNNREECVKYFNKFKRQFLYLDNINLKFTPDENYNLYNKDLENINSGMPECVSLIDTRNLPERNNEPNRLLIKDNFFRATLEEKNENILHELGHFFTNQTFKELRQYLSINNPEQIEIQNFENQKLIDNHNKGLSYLWDIPKLPLEINAELWIYENEPEYSESRIKRYCIGVNTEFSENDKIKYFYKIPFINFHIIYRCLTVKKVNFDFTNDCLARLDKANNRLFKIANNFGWNGLKQLAFQSNILKSVEYKNENISNLIKIYEEIFEEYIKISASFFSEDFQNEILKLYNIESN